MVCADAHRDDIAPSHDNPNKEGGNGKSRKGTRLPEDWTPGDAGFLFARELEIDPDDQLARFRDYWIARAGQGGVKLDWFRTWCNWCRKAADDNRRPAANPRRGGSIVEAANRVLASYRNNAGG